MPELESVPESVVEPVKPVEVVDALPVVEKVEPVEETEVHPLEPGGKRFEQVWARAKKAEEDARKVREEKIALETELRVRKELETSPPKKEAEKVYNWEELEGLIESGNLTRAQAQTYREDVIRKQTLQEAEQRITQKQEAVNVTESVRGEINRYTKAVPTLLQQDSSDYKRVEAEFNWLTTIYGAPKDDTEMRKRQLIALRAAYGTADAAEKRAGLSKASDDGKDTIMDSTGTSKGKTPPVADGQPKGLSEAEVEHYNKMIKQGRYKEGWKSINEEIAFYNKLKGIK
jgi:hypothetical protein